MEAHKLATRYSPMPVADPWARPTWPVKPRSKTRGTSAAGMPQPLSRTSSTVRPRGVPDSSSRAVNSMLVAPYFAAFVTTCPKMNTSHGSSASTVMVSGILKAGSAPRSMRKRVLRLHASRAASPKLTSRMA